MIKKNLISIDDYIYTQPESVQPILEELRSIIKEMAPTVGESIRYDMPTFTLSGKHLIYFAAWKKHLSLYPFTMNMEDVLKAETSRYKTSGKGTIQFPLDQPLPVPLIKKIIAIRIKENQE